MTNQPCTACGWTLRFVPERNGWGCDRCHAFVPQGAPLPSPSASPWAPPGGSAAVSPTVASPYAPPAAHAPDAYAPPPPAASPYAPPPYGAPAPAPYTPQRYSPQTPPPMPYPPPPHGVPAAGANKRMWMFGAAAAAVIAIIVTIVVLTRSSGGVGSREEIINETFAALSAGDVDKLVRLVDPKNLFDRVLDCSANDDDEELTPKEVEREFREKAERLVDKVKGRKLEVVAVENQKIDRDFGDGRAYGGKKDSGLIRKGDKVFDGCRARETFRAHEVIVTVKETRPGKKAKKKRAKLELLEVDGDWYLVDAPRGRSSDDIAGLGDDDGDDDEMLEKMREFKNAMCACRDKVCANRVTDEMTKWSTEITKRDSGDRAAKISPRLESITKQFGDCMMKALTEE